MSGRRDRLVLRDPEIRLAVAVPVGDEVRDQVEEEGVAEKRRRVVVPRERERVGDAERKCNRGDPSEPGVEAALCRVRPRLSLGYYSGNLGCGGEPAAGAPALGVASIASMSGERSSWLST